MLERYALEHTRHCLAFLAACEPDTLRGIFLRNYGILRPKLEKLRHDKVWNGNTDRADAQTYAETILEALADADEDTARGILQDISRTYTKPLSEYGMSPEEEQATIESTIDHIAPTPEELSAARFLLLEMYTMDKHTPGLFQRMRMSNMSCLEDRMNALARAYRFKTPYREDPHIIKNMERLRARVTDYFADLADTDLSDQPDLARLLYLYATGPDTPIPGATCIGTGLYTGHPLPMPYSYITDFLSAHKIVLEKVPYADECVQVIDEAIDTLLCMYVMELYSSHAAHEFKEWGGSFLPKEGEGDPGLPEAMRNYKDARPAMNQNVVNREIREMDISPIAASCLWATAIRLLMIALPAVKKDSMLAGLDGQEGGHAAASAIKNLEMAQEECRRKDSSIRQLAQEISELKQKQASLVREQVAQAEEDYMGQVREANRAKGKTEEENKRLKKLLLQEQEKNRALEEKTDILMRCRADPGLPEIDLNGRYLFVCNHEPTNRKLKEWFPNAMVSPAFNITPKNAENIDLVVCISKESRHTEYYRIKKQCARNNVPLTHCHNLNFEFICRAIASALSSEADAEA